MDFKLMLKPTYKYTNYYDVQDGRATKVWLYCCQSKFKHSIS